MSLKTDFLSGLSLALIALPLSIGIAIASGAPPASGIVAAVVGGILGAMITGSKLTVNGPAAGLSVVVLTSIQVLGQGDLFSGYRQTLAITVIAGIIQIGLGVLRAGRLGLLVPGSAIHGLLTSIGLIIMVKQSHVVLGQKSPNGDFMASFLGIGHSVVHLNGMITLVGLGSLLILILWNKIARGTLRLIPGPLLAVLWGLAFGIGLDLDHPHIIHMLTWDFPLDQTYLLNIPENLSGYLVMPDFSHIGETASLRMLVLIALVASVESVLSAHAVDKIDPAKSRSNLDLELGAKGVLNIVSGFLGGLPIIAEIVRSSANVAAGAKSQWSNFFHGLLILLMVVSFPRVLHEIPLAALAAILLMVGYRLAHPKQWIHQWHLGLRSLTVFLFTIFFCLYEDILVGVTAGLSLEFLLNAASARCVLGLFRLRTEAQELSDHTLLKLEGPLVFSNLLKLKKTLQSFSGSHLVLDLGSASFVDATAREHLEELRSQPESGIEIRGY